MIRRWIWGFALLVWLVIWLNSHFSTDARSVTIYCSHDRSHSQQILDRFEKETGIVVDAVFDTEATKTVGLTERIRSEQKRPRCDVHWSNEPLRAVQLAQEGHYDTLPEGAGPGIDSRWRDAGNLWCGFAARARVVAVHPESLASAAIPRSVKGLIDPSLSGKVVMADPRFGTTGSHLAILRVTLGAQRYRELLQGWKDNRIQIASSNSSSRDRVLSGEAWVGLTDTDDVEVVRRRGASIGEGFLAEDGVILLPNVVAVVKGCPHPEEADELARWLLREEVEEWLANSPSRQIPLRTEVPVIASGLSLSRFEPLEIDWSEAAGQLHEAIREAERILLNP